MEGSIYHVIPNGPADAWLVVQESGDFRIEFCVKDEAVLFANQRARAHAPARVKVHAREGTIEQESAYT
jgi:hypothetical protein